MNVFFGITIPDLVKSFSCVSSVLAVVLESLDTFLTSFLEIFHCLSLPALFCVALFEFLDDTSHSRSQHLDTLG